MAEVADVHVEHVERNVVGRGTLDEREGRREIDEAANQPRRRHAIDSGTRPRDPAALRERLCG